MMKRPVLSVIVPLYNEAAGISAFHSSLVVALKKLHVEYEIIYCDDGSRDDTTDIAGALCNTRVRLIALSRNFGKEYALSAGLAHARGEAVLLLDGDGQHPVNRIGDFVQRWKEGAQVVIGVRDSSKADTHFKRHSSRVFYSIINRISHQAMVPGSTDFRLLDAAVVKEFVRLEETGRMARGLIDWLGFTREYVYFQALPREYGTASYSVPRLFRLAGQTIISLSFVPLYVFGWLGVIITVVTGLLGLFLLIEQLILGDPLHIRFTGTALLGTLTLFLVGVILMAIGMLSVYVAAISAEVRRRPLYVVNWARSKGFSVHD